MIVNHCMHDLFKKVKTVTKKDSDCCLFIIVDVLSVEFLLVREVIPYEHLQ